MTLRANGPVPSPNPRARLSASPPNGLVEVEAPSPAVEAVESTWLPATGGSLTLCFLGQPDSSAAPAMSKAIDMIRFIYFSIQRSLSDQLFASVPAIRLFV